MRNQCRGCGENRGGGAIIRLQPDDFRAVEIPFEPQDVFHLSAAPGIDRLVVIADAADVLPLLRQQAEPEILDNVGVLILVH